MKPRSTGPRRASVELRFEPGQSEFPIIAGRALPQFWSLLAPSFRGVFLPPQWRAEGNGIAWSWREPASNPSISPAELATLRKRLAGAQRSFAATAADAPATSDPRSPIATLAPLAACLDELITTLLALPDPAFTAYTARTETGLAIHSWGLRSPLTPFYPDTADREISGTVFIAKQAAPNLSVFLETPEGQPISRTTSDANGCFHFLQLAPGHYRVRADSPVTPFPPEGLAVETQRASVSDLELHDLAHRLSATKRSFPQLSGHRRSFVVMSLVALALVGLALLWIGRNSAPVLASTTSSTATSFAPDTLARDSGDEPLPLNPRVVEPVSRPSVLARREVAREPTAIAPPSHTTPLPPTAFPAPSGQPSPTATASDPSATPTTSSINSAPSSASSSPPHPSETSPGSSPSSPSPSATSQNAPSAKNPHTNPTPPTPAPNPPTPARKSSAPDPKTRPVSSATTPTPAPPSTQPEPPATPAPKPHRESSQLQPEENPPSARSIKRPTPDVESSTPKTASATPRSSASANSASPPKSTPPTQPSSEPVPTDSADSPSTSTEFTSSDSAAPLTAPGSFQLRLRLSTWRLRLLHDSILPTQPTRVGASSAESPGALRTRLYREHQKKIPAAFLAPITRRGFALELPLSSPPVVWQLASPSSSLVASATAARAELSWIDTTPPPPGSRFELTTASGHVVAAIVFDADSEAHLTFSPPLRAWPWLELVSPAPIPHLAYLILSGPDAPSTWQLQATRLDLITPAVEPGRQQRTLALSDKTTGWSLITDLTQTTEQ